MDTPGTNYLKSAVKVFQYYKGVGDKVIVKLNTEQLQWLYNEQSNSIAVIIKHVAGNSLSRWTNFLTEDGEKEWRDRDGEFEDAALDKDALTKLWEQGWQCLFDAIIPLTESDLMTIIYIRREAHTIIEAINRQLAHVPYHVGQMVYIGKMIDTEWRSLTIPKGASKAFNAGMANNPRGQ